MKISNRSLFYLVSAIIVTLALLLGGERVHRFWSVRQLQNSGPWVVNFFPNHQGQSNADFPIPRWCTKSLDVLHRCGIYRGEWLKDGPAIASLFQPVERISFTATDAGMSKGSRTFCHFRQLNSLRIRFEPDHTGPVSDEALHRFFEELSNLKTLRSLALIGFPDGQIGVLQDFGKQSQISGLTISIVGSEINSLDWAGDFSALEYLRVSLPENNFDDRWAWLKESRNLQSFNLNLSYEVDVDQIRAQLPEGCDFSLNGLTLSDELWPGL